MYGEELGWIKWEQTRLTPSFSICADWKFEHECMIGTRDNIGIECMIGTKRQIAHTSRQKYVRRQL